MAFPWTWLLALALLAGTAQSCNPPPGAQNLARGRLASQSSTYPQQQGIITSVAGNAIDGNRNGLWTQGSCSHTGNDFSPWWTVDLGDQYAVTAVLVKNREDCCSWRLQGAQIHVGDSVADHGKSRPPVCGTITDLSPGSLSTICCNGLVGRYVTVTIPGREDWLQLCEVEVYGTKVEDECVL